MGLPALLLDTTRPWASWDRPLLWCEAGTRRRWSCRCCSSTGRDHGRRGIDRCSAAKRADGGDGAAGDAARRDAAMGVLGSTAALARGGQAAAMELPVMQLDTPRPWASRIDRRSAARRAGGGDGAAGDAARRDAAMDVVESTAALLRGEQAAAMELPVMQLDTSRPWASRIDPCSGARRAGGGDGAAGDAARRDAAMGVLGPTAALLRGERAEAMALPVMQLDAARPCASWDRPLLCCEASRRRRGSCR
jgi:hypothetical protein